MARRRKSKTHKGFWGVLNSVLPIMSFVSQVTVKERASYSSLPTFDKFKAMANNITGNIFGVNFFGGSTPQFTEKWNPAGIANRYTYLGLGGIGLKLLSRYVLKPSKISVPYIGRVSGLAVKFLPAGVFGGLFDTPSSTTNYNPQTTTYQTYHTNGEVTTT